ncbi:MAG: serine hydrolase [Phycisphaerales bacterium]|nr:serine hydrolase [Phycisphaerales bacterium]
MKPASVIAAFGLAVSIGSPLLAQGTAPAPAQQAAGEPLDAAHRFIEAEIRAKRIVGAVVFAQSRDESAWTSLALGLAQQGTGAGAVPMRTDHLFHIASMTKPVTATVVMILVERGTLDLDTPVSAYLDEFKDAKLPDGTPCEAPTLRQLLSHTGGAPGNNDRNSLFREDTMDRNASLEANIEALASKGLSAAPGTKYAYSGLGFSIAARVAEKASGKEFESLCRELLFAPLGMDHTAFRPSSDAFSAKAKGYRKTAQNEWRELIEVKPPAPGAYINAGGGLYSTGEDMLKFFRLHALGGEVDGKRLLSESSIKAMHTRQSDFATYGLGFQLAPDTETGAVSRFVHHGGALGTLAIVDSETGLAGIVLTQTPAAQSRAFLRAVQERIFAGYGVTLPSEEETEGVVEGAADPRMVVQGDLSGQGKGLAEALRQMDKDADGRVSRSEWTRRPEAFDLIDGDKDGFLTGEEVKAMAERLGGGRPNRRPPGGG